MKKKYLTKKERIQKEALQYLSRRDFLGMGLKLSSSSLAMPLLAKTVFHETSAFAEISGGGSAPYPVIQMHLSGGCATHVVPLKADGTTLTGAALGNYGVNPNSATFQSHFGVQWFNRTVNFNGTPETGFIEGLMSKLGSADPNRIQMFAVPNSSRDDNDTNEVGCHSVLSAGGFVGKLTDGIGFRRTETGMGNSSALPQVKKSPFIASNAQNIRELLSYTPAFTGRSQSLLDNFANALKDLGDLQAPRVFEKAERKDQSIQAVSNAFQDNKNFTGPNSTNLNVATLPIYGQVFDNVFNFNGQVQNQALNNDPGGLLRFATALRAAFLGLVPFVGYNMPFGYDYHGQNLRDAQDNPGTQSRDRMAGMVAGAVMNLAFAENSNAILVITTDGSVNGKPDETAGINNANGNGNIWLGDRGEHNMLLCAVIHGNNGASVLNRINGRTQIGAMRADTGTVDSTRLSGKNDLAAASVVAANILAINGVSPEKILAVFPSFGSVSILMEHLVFQTS